MTNIEGPDIKKDSDNIQKTICAVVVTYNRKQLLLECLAALLKQTRPLDAIYLIDNASTDGTPEVLKNNGYIKEVLDAQKKDLENEYKMKMISFENQDKELSIHYVRMHENTGGAGGFYEGIKRGYEKGYDWLWVMDDDVTAENNCLNELLNGIRIIKEKEDIDFIALACARYADGLFVNDGTKKINLNDPFKKLQSQRTTDEDLVQDYFILEGTTFEGLLISKRIILRVGFPDRRFFIYGDDTEYCLRILRIGKIFCIPSAKLNRRRLVTCQRGLKYTWKNFYILRNMIYIDLKYTNLGVKIIRNFYRLIKAVLGRIYYRHFNDLFLIKKSLFDAIKMLKEN